MNYLSPCIAAWDLKVWLRTRVQNSLVKGKNAKKKMNKACENMNIKSRSITKVRMFKNQSEKIIPDNLERKLHFVSRECNTSHKNRRRMKYQIRAKTLMVA